MAARIALDAVGQNKETTPAQETARAAADGQVVPDRRAPGFLTLFFAKGEMLNERTFALSLKEGDFLIEAGDLRRQRNFFPLSLTYPLINPPSQGLSHHIESLIAKKLRTNYNVLKMPRWFFLMMA